MTQIGKGGRPSAEVLASLKRMIAEVALHNCAAPTTKAAVAAYCNVDTATLWRHAQKSREVSALITQLLDGGKAFHAQPAASEIPAGTEFELRPVGAPPLADLTPEDLSRRASKPVRVARAAAERWGARSRRVKHVSDLPAAMYHLQVAQRQLGNALEQLAPLVEEWLRRSRQSSGAVPDAQRDLLADADDTPVGAQ